MALISPLHLAGLSGCRWCLKSSAAQLTRQLPHGSRGGRSSFAALCSLGFWPSIGTAVWQRG